MEKRVKKIGGSYCIVLNKDDREIYRIGEGDIVQFTLTKIERDAPLSSDGTEKETETPEVILD